MVKKEKKVTRIDPVRTTQPLEQTQEKRVCAYCRISTDSEDQKHSEYYGTAEPPVRCGESHLSGLTEPLHFVY